MTLIANATYSFNGRDMIVDLDASNGDFRSFRVERGPNESRSSAYERAYSQADFWATQRGLTLQTFRAAA